MVAPNYVLTWIVALGFLLLPHLGFAQKWQNLQTFESTGNQNTGDLHCNETGDCAVGFTFQGQLNLSGRILNSRGGSDFVVMLRKKGATKSTYFTHGGGPLDEEIVAVRPRSNGGLLCAGIFWNELKLPDTTLLARDGGKAIFLTAHKANGQVEWAKVIDGTGLKSVTDMVLNENGNIWVSGYFSDTLFIGREKVYTEGETEMFLLRLNEDGSTQWIRNHGTAGVTRIVGIAPLPGRAIVGIGYFDESVRFDASIFGSNTSDQDLFLVAWGPDGQVLWAKKGGGVYDATPVDIATDEQGRIYFCGNIVGVIRFDGGPNIQSKDGNADVFLGSFSPAGAPLWARVISGDQIQEFSRMALSKDKIYLSGYTLGDFTWAGTNLKPVDGFTSFLGISDTLGRQVAASLLDADGGLYTGGLAYTPEGQLYLAGVYRGTGALDALPLLKKPNYTFFTADFSTLVTGIPQILVDDPAFQVFPIPSSGDLLITSRSTDAYVAVLCDALGRQLEVFKGSPQNLDLSRLNAGMYVLQIRKENAWYVYKVIKR
jgi:hypothetical protein